MNIVKEKHGKLKLHFKYLQYKVSFKIELNSQVRVDVKHFKKLSKLLIRLKRFHKRSRHSGIILQS